MTYITIGGKSQCVTIRWPKETWDIPETLEVLTCSNIYVLKQKY